MVILTADIQIPDDSFNVLDRYVGKSTTKEVENLNRKPLPKDLLQISTSTPRYIANHNESIGNIKI